MPDPRVAGARAAVLAALPPYRESGAFPGAVLLLAPGRVVAAHEAYGDAVRYAADGSALPVPERVPVQRDTVYDLASITKTVTAVVVLALAERGLLDLDGRVGELLPAFRGGGKEAVRIRDLLTHTAGLPATIELWHHPGERAELLDRVARTPLVSEPGKRYLYSDLGPMLAGAVAELCGGARLDELVAGYVTGPLGMADTGFRPSGDRLARCAATEAQPWTGRPMIRGDVHDENAWALGGVAGHAGLFGTAADVGALAGLLAGGGQNPSGVLSPESVELMLADHGAGNGMGADVGRVSTTGRLASPRTASHTGFTGTFWVADRRTGSYAVLLTNRVHPSRHGGGVNASRVAVAEALLPG
ncbi:MAG TPA: serine hydrolase domain-containing protein [Streptosporangiales bacterium]